MASERRPRALNLNAPSLAELQAAFDNPEARNLGPSILQGVASGIDFSQKLADRKLRREREQQIIDQQAREQQVLEEQRQKQRQEEQGISTLAKRLNPANRVAANIGDQQVTAGETRAFAEDPNAQVEADLFKNLPPRESVDRFLAKRDAASKLEGSLAEIRERGRQARLTAGQKATGGKKERDIPAALINAELVSGKTENMLETVRSILPKIQPATFLGNVKTVLQKGQELGRGRFGGDIGLIAYERARPAAGRAIYKDISGDVGNLAEKEGEIGTDLLPTTIDSPELAEALTSNLEQLYAKASEKRRELAEFIKQNNLTAKEAEELVEKEMNNLIVEAKAGALSVKAKFGEGASSKKNPSELDDLIEDN